MLNPRDRVPCGLIVDDSTCLVNMAYFCMPQFAAVWPKRKDYQKPWQSWPREIPDQFVREFGQWSHDQGVKGKYSIVPYPACVGWLDRGLPGWGQSELRDSLQLVRDLMMPDWDIHPEMISHTRVINTKTGRPYKEQSPRFMENWQWTDGKSVDQLADYLQYALRILQNVQMPCEGVTTPGGFAGRVRSELAQATFQACRDVGKIEIPHYFKYVETGDGSTDPRVEFAEAISTDNASCVVSMVAGTGDWFGGWDGVSYADVDASAARFVSDDLESGRMVELIERKQAAYMLCHWPGLYCNGMRVGYRIYQEAVRRLNQGFGDRIVWMKLSDLARYSAARALSSIERQGDVISVFAPFAAPDFTLSVDRSRSRPLRVEPAGEDSINLREVDRASALEAGRFHAEKSQVKICFDLPKGWTRIHV